VQKKKRVAQRQAKLACKRAKKQEKGKVGNPMPAELSMKKQHWGQSQQ
jgi:hypothetical protein